MQVNCILKKTNMDIKKVLYSPGMYNKKESATRNTAPAGDSRHKRKLVFEVINDN